MPLRTYQVFSSEELRTRPQKLSRKAPPVCPTIVLETEHSAIVVAKLS